MSNIRASAVVTTLLVAAVSAVSIGIAAAGGVTATAQPNTVIRASAFVVPTTTLENEIVTLSDFRAFSIDQITIDVVTATDAVAISFDTAFTDSVTATDVINKMFYGNIDFDLTDPDIDPDPIVVADIDAKDVGKTLTDTATATDSPAKTPGKVVTDSVTSADVITTKDVGKSLTDTATTNDTINTFNTDKVLVDSATATDAAAKDFTRPNVTDSVTTADDSSRQPELGKTETVTASDTLNNFDIGVNPSDAATATDAVNTFAVNKVLTDTVEMTDFIAKTPGYNFDFDVVDADADPDPVTMGDVMAKEFTRPNITDTATAADAPAFAVNNLQTDAVTMAEATAFAVDDVQTDSVTATDATALNFGSVQTDSATAADAITAFAIGDVQTDTVTASDAINSFVISDVQTDSVTMADSIATLLVLGQTTPIYPDYVSMADGGGFVFHRYTTNVPNYTEVLGGADSLLNSDYLQNASDSHTHESYTGLINGPGLLLTAPLISGEFITYADTSGAGLVVNFHYTDAADRTVGGYQFNQTPIL
jgi:hypothetical protein